MFIEEGQQVRMAENVVAKTTVFETKVQVLEGLYRVAGIDILSLC